MFVQSIGDTCINIYSAIYTIHMHTNHFKCFTSKSLWQEHIQCLCMDTFDFDTSSLKAISYYNHHHEATVQILFKCQGVPMSETTSYFNHDHDVTVQILFKCQGYLCQKLQVITTTIMRSLCKYYLTARGYLCPKLHKATDKVQCSK